MRRLPQILLAVGVLAALGGAVSGALIYALIFRGLPEIYGLKDYRPLLITRVLAADGTEIASFSRERRVVVPIEEIPTYLVEAFVAAEDDAFYQHEGLDYPSILRAAWANLRAGGIEQGGSTITQQVAKTFLLTPERRWIRKLKDMILARRIEQHFAKNEILYLYLNQIYLGSGAYGVEAAARVYFNKSVSELSLAEAALIAGLPPAPSLYSPYSSVELARSRQRFVLDQMLEEGYVSQEQHDAALEEELDFGRPPTPELIAASAYFSEEVRRYLVARYGADRVLTDGLEVRTTVDPTAQLAAYRALRRGLRDHDRRAGYRGPERTVPVEEWPAVLDELTDANAEAAEAGETVFSGLVLEVDDGAGVARIALGLDGEALLTLQDVSWAREPNPSLDGAIPQVRKVGQALQAGLLIQVEYTGERVPEDAEPDPETGAPESVPVYTLYQEPLTEGALFSMEVETGRVLAIVGGYDFGRSQFDRAVQMRRQPGSAFKPIVYATALTRGFTPATIVYDKPIVYEDAERGFTWKPNNYSEKWYGPITLRQALAKSRNLATVDVLNTMGIEPVVDMARSLGIEGDLSPNLSLGLGSSEVTLAEIVRAYSAFASGGRVVEPVFIEEVRDREDTVIAENVTLADALAAVAGAELETEGSRLDPVEDEGEFERIIDELRASVDAGARDAPPPGYRLHPAIAYLMTDMLQAVVQEGTGWRAKALGRPVAGKTGTTNDMHDAWFIGFTPQVISGVWVGYDTARSLGANEAGSRAAGPIFVEYSAEVLKALPPVDFSIPAGIEFTRIDADTGLRSCPGDEHAIFQPFREGTSPLDVAPCYSGNGRSATPRLD